MTIITRRLYVHNAHHVSSFQSPVASSLLSMLLHQSKPVAPLQGRMQYHMAWEILCRHSGIRDSNGSWWRSVQWNVVSIAGPGLEELTRSSLELRNLHMD